MLFQQNIGIVSYGTYVPKFALAGETIADAHQSSPDTPRSLGVKQKTVPDCDEDTATLAVAAASQALSRWENEVSSKDIQVSAVQKQQKRQSLGALFIGSESHPYAVKPTGTMVKEALDLPEKMAVADLQFACKAGTQAVQICAAYVAAGLIESGLGIGADTAQSKPGDVLEFTAAAGAAAMVVGRDKKEILAKIIATTSLVSDTPDFWRRPGQPYPEHAGRFSGEPGYFSHVIKNTKNLLEEVSLTPKDIDWCVFHTPNGKFPQLAAKRLGFSPEQLLPSLVVKEIGNTYAAASLLALSAVLDQAEAGQKILVCSYGSGAGSDSFLLETTSVLVERRKKWSGFLREQISRTKQISYQDYVRKTGSGH